MSAIPLIFIVAGEASGDQLGAELMAQLKKTQEVRFAGIGGPAMIAQGLSSLFPMEELSIMGVGGILRKLAHLLQRLHYTVKTIQEIKPHVVITIDAPEFSFRVLKRLHQQASRPRLIHYVAPTVWAWRPWRARKISRFVDLLFCLYPFEPPYFERHGLKSLFVGHPVAKPHASLRDPHPPLDGKAGDELNHIADYSTDANVLWIPDQVRDDTVRGCGLYKQQCLNEDHVARDLSPPPGCHPGLDPGSAKRFKNNELSHLSSLRGEQNLLCLLPGSRRSEIETLLPIFEKTVALLRKEIPDLQVVLPTLPRMKDLVEAKTQNWLVPVQIVIGNDAREKTFQQASVALAASGTIALELAATGLPFVIAYKVSLLNEWIARVLLKTPWVCMINILLAFHTFGPSFILNRQANEKIKAPWIPEFLQKECTPENLANALLKLFRDPEARNHQEQAMAQATELLRVPPYIAASIVCKEINIIN